MANPTTNFGWVMPTSTSLVTNLPADFNTFGQGVDTSMAQLKGGTTGQVLSKTSATDMAFTWVTPTDQTPLTTKGDLFTFTTVDARLAVGTNGQVLQADSTAATGLKWATPASGSLTKITSASFSSVASVSLPNGTFSSTYRNYKVLFTISDISTAQTITGRYRTSGTDETGAAYYGANTGTRMDNAGVVIVNNNGATSFTLGYTLGSYQAVALDLTFFSPNQAVRKQFSGTGVTGDSTFNNYATRILAGQWITASAVDSFSFIVNTGTITGSYAVYGLEN